MTETDRRILETFASRVRAQFPNARIWAFGSRVRDQAGPGSDLDICVVLDELTEDRDRQIISIAWETGFEHEAVISTITFSQAEFSSGPLARSPIVARIREEGVAA